MLSLGWTEIGIIFIIVIVIIGPNEIPNLLKQFGGYNNIFFKTK